jgi:hypothetical protein
MKRLAPLTLTAAAALVLAACTSDADANDYDEPTEMGVAMATDYYNESADESYGPELSVEEFTTRAKDVCDRLSEEPTYEEFDDVIEQVADEDDTMHHNAAVTLVLQGSGQFCMDKFESAHGD